MAVLQISMFHRFKILFMPAPLVYWNRLSNECIQKLYTSFA